ncbi:MAG: protein kinase [Parachlamydiaceae bacterium]|nr:protein kinase [Parachlamydiaceae bacterium]
MDYFEGGDLNSQVKNPDLKRKVYIMAKSAEQLAVLHQLGFAHRDFKPTNILLEKNLKPRTTDFGMTCRIGLKAVADATPGFQCPEMLVSQALNKNYYADPKADVWGLGITMLVLLSGNSWFYSWSRLPEDPNVILQNLPGMITDVFNRIGSASNYNERMMELLFVIQGCLQFDPNFRLTPDEVAVRLSKIYGAMPKQVQISQPSKSSMTTS